MRQREVVRATNKIDQPFDDLRVRAFSEQFLTNDLRRRLCAAESIPLPSLVTLPLPCWQSRHTF